MYKVNNETGFALRIKIRDGKMYLGSGHEGGIFAFGTEFPFSRE